ncbi:thiamine biosynthesis protein ThiF [Actinomyces faecalis]|uniref:thiamine biosynthesis protein ThiF n=1 Tax=Actinomyces faecalis TaxID=2722820 RepID=UPI001551AB12|nr:thiamine biosynthesis protein ThiF [Actinomyces faecalis]
MLRVRGHSPVLWRGPGQCQIGVDPAQALVLDGLAECEQHLLLRLQDGATAEDVYRASRATHTPLARAHALVRLLRSEGVLLPDKNHPRDCDESYWEHLVRSPTERSRSLRKRTVALLGTGPLTAQLARLLAESGVGALLSEDPAVTQDLASGFPRLRGYQNDREGPDLVVLIDPYVIDPVRERALTQAGVPHLSVTCSEVTIRVGPLFDDVSAVCRTCLELWECEADPCWPTLATQARLLPAASLERLLVHQAAALTARAVLECLVDRPGAWRGLSVDVSALAPLGVVRQWQVHPRCLGALTRQGSEPPQDQDQSALADR